MAGKHLFAIVPDVLRTVVRCRRPARPAALSLDDSQRAFRRRTLADPDDTGDPGQQRVRQHGQATGRDGKKRKSGKAARRNDREEKKSSTEETRRRKAAQSSGTRPRRSGEFQESGGVIRPWKGRRDGDVFARKFEALSANETVFVKRPGPRARRSLTAGVVAEVPMRQLVVDGTVGARLESMPWNHLNLFSKTSR